MPKLPIASGTDVIRALERSGFAVLRQRGSHVSLGKRDPTVVVTVPLHDEIARGTLRAIIRQSGLSVDEFVALLGR